MLAAIDIGSNTAQLMLAEISDGHFLSRTNLIRTTRLGSGSDGVLSEQAIAETAAAVAEYMKLIHDAGVTQVRMVATSAVRDAVNADALREAIRSAAPDAPPLIVLSGREEAETSYAGACASIGPNCRFPVFDLGGSSGELIWRDSGELCCISCNIGAVRAHKNGWEKEDIYRFVAENYPIADYGRTLIGVGGTITTAAGVLKGLTAFDRDAIEGAVLCRDDLESLLNVLLPLSIQERCSYSPLLERRGEIMEEGLTVWLAIMDTLGFHHVQVTGGGILDGVILQMI